MMQLDKVTEVDKHKDFGHLACAWFFQELAEPHVFLSLFLS